MAPVNHLKTIVAGPELSDTFVKESWEQLKNVVLRILTNGTVGVSTENLYQLCETLCQYEKASYVYQKIHDQLSAYVQNQLQLLSTESLTDTAFCETVYSLWIKYTNQIVQIRCIFLYLDRTYFAHNTKYGSIWDMAIDIFKSNILKYDIIWQKVLNGILTMIRLQRSNNTVDEGVLQRNIRMLLDLNLYHSAFERFLLDETRQFYDKEGSHLIQTMNIFDYLDHVASRLHQESTIRIRSYLDKSTKSSIQSIVGNELLIRRVTTILEKSFQYFLQLESIEDIDYARLSLLYRLLQKVDKIDICSRYFTMYVKQKGSRILRSNNEDVVQKILKLSQFESQVDEVVDHSFEGDELFVEGLKEGIEYFSNLKENNVIKILAKYIDQVLRNSKRTLDQTLLDKGMFLFQNIRAKDEFEMIYKRDLAKRLLLNESSQQAEKFMLAKMKDECGAGYTGKMEGMVKDIEKSVDLMREFNMENKGSVPTLNVNLLTYGFWPSYTPTTINLPPVFKNLQNVYNEFYTGKYKRRILTWQNTLSICEVLCHYPLVS
ncbi:Cullin [Mycotypha africana]|uniref:Cullin n=1 Tax=Mycotypha africana TaxID=64632 RepID=UPI0022FFF424|nr:Cullin [Mycotypha africana]KAI8975613.1 Cullin [Mycotypha africana]